MDLFRQKNIALTVRDIKQNPPTAEELQRWHEASGLEIGKFYNTSGISYRKGNIKEKRATLSLEEQYTLLASDPMLIKRPILVDEDTVRVGVDVRKFAESLEAPKRCVVASGETDAAQ